MNTKWYNAAILGLLLIAGAVYSQDGWKTILSIPYGDKYLVSRIQHMKHGIIRAWIKRVSDVDVPTSDALRRLGHPVPSLLPDMISFLDSIDPLMGHNEYQDSLLLSRTIDYSLDLEEFDCSERRKRTLTYTTYFDDGQAVRVPPNEKDSVWQFVIPETAWDSVLNYICKH